MTYHEILGILSEQFAKNADLPVISILEKGASALYKIINSTTSKESLDVTPIVDKAIDLGIAVEKELAKKPRNLGGGRLQDKKEPKVAQMTQKKRETSGEFAVPNLSPREQKLYDFLKENPDASTNEIMQHLGIDTPQTAYVVKSSLKAKLNLMKPLKDRK